MLNVEQKDIHFKRITAHSTAHNTVGVMWIDEWSLLIGK